MSNTPYELIVAPFSVYVGPLGEAFTIIETTPAGNWVLLGTNGTENMDEAGVTVSHQQTVDQHHVYGVTPPVKATRSQSQITISFTLLDLTLEEYARILDDGTVTTTGQGGGAAGFKDVNLGLGLDVSEKAYLIRGTGASPEGTGWNMQYEIPRAYVSGSPSVVFTKNAPAGLEFELTQLYDTGEAAGEEMGRILVQHQAVS